MAGIFRDAAQSFYSGPFYGRLARERTGIGMGLILFLTLLVSFLMFAGLAMDKDLRDAVDQFPEVAEKLPMITLSGEGRLSIDKPMPYRLDLGHAPRSLWFVIDTNYKRTDDDATLRYMRENHILMLMTASEAILDKSRQNQLQVYEFKSGQPFTVTHETWGRIAATIHEWGFFALATFFFCIFTFTMFFFNLIATLATAAAVMALALLASTSLEFAAAMRLAAAARIPVNVLPALPVFFGQPWLANASGWVLWAIYVIFAVYAVRIYSAQQAKS